MKSIDRQCKHSATNITGIKYGIVQDTELHNSVFDTSNICSAVFTLAINRLHSFKRQPFWFHSLNSMVPVKGIDLFY